eukprot:3941339-Rhodomonas_salina.1
MCKLAGQSNKLHLQFSLKHPLCVGYHGAIQWAEKAVQRHHDNFPLWKDMNLKERHQKKPPLPRVRDWGLGGETGWGQVRLEGLGKEEGLGGRSEAREGRSLRRRSEAGQQRSSRGAEEQLQY